MKKQASTKPSALVEIIQNKIYLIRGQRVMLDKDLAELYGVSTSQLTRQVRRNIERFPDDFLVELTREEFNNLMCQIGISSWGGTRKLPFAFTEQGIAMLSGVLNSTRAIQVNVQIMRVFTKLREIMITHKDLSAKLAEVEGKVNRHDRDIQFIFEAIRDLMVKTRASKVLTEPLPNDDYKRRKAGFIVDQ